MNAAVGRLSDTYVQLLPVLFADMRSLGSRLYSTPSFIRPVGGLSPEKLGFNPKPVHVGFVINKVALGQVIPRVLRLTPVSTIPLNDSSVPNAI